MRGDKRCILRRAKKHRVVILNIYCNSINNTFLGFYGDQSVNFESGVIIFVTGTVVNSTLLKPGGYFMYRNVKVQIERRGLKQDQDERNRI